MKKRNNKIIILIVCVVGIVLLSILGYLIYMKSVYLSKNEVKEIIKKDTNLSDSDIKFEEIELELDGEIKKYEVLFYYNREEYKYEIDANNGEIIYSNFINKFNSSDNNFELNNDTSSNNNSGSNNDNTSSDNNYISIEEAKKIALDDANINSSEATFTDIDLERQNGKVIYEIDFETSTTEYEYKIDGINKNIISKKQEPRD